MKKVFLSLLLPLFLATSQNNALSLWSKQAPIAPVVKPLNHHAIMGSLTGLLGSIGGAYTIHSRDPKRFLKGFYLGKLATTSASVLYKGIQGTDISRNDLLEPIMSIGCSALHTLFTHTFLPNTADQKAKHLVFSALAFWCISKGLSSLAKATGIYV